jgi:hypothetical protein
MDQEIINTFLGVIRIPAWLEASLAVLSISVFLFLSFRKSRAQVEALESLTAQAKSNKALNSELVVFMRNQNQILKEVMALNNLVPMEFAERLVIKAIRSAHTETQLFAEANRSNPDIKVLAHGFMQDSFFDFCSFLGSVRCVDGTELGDFARLCYDEFEFWAHGVEYNPDMYVPSERLLIQLTQKWRRWSGLNISRKS